jgi:small subunit ribosomal protein S1
MAGSSDEYVEFAGTADNADYQAFLDDYSSHFPSSDREVLHGRVLSVSDKEVIVDIGRKTEGLVPAVQFPFIEGRPAVKTGDAIEVMIDRSGEQVEGYILLSYERAHRIQVWENLEKAAAEGTPVPGRVVNKIKGGLAVDIGVGAFLPSSQVEIRPVHNLDAYVGREIDVRILKLNRRRGNAVVSHRVLLEQQLSAQKAKALADIREGAEVTGTVKNLTEYGAFVDLGGIDGLLHVSDLS